MRTRPVRFAGLLLLIAVARAQDLTVHTVAEGTGKPLEGIAVTIRHDFRENRRARKQDLQTVKSDKDGNAVFRTVQLGPGGFSVSVFSMEHRAVGLEPVFLPSGQSGGVQNQTYTALPATVSIVVHRNSLREMMELIYPGP